MTVYKAIKQEADAASKLAIALSKEQPPAAGLVNGKSNDTKRQVPSVLLKPQAITKDNVNVRLRRRLPQEVRRLHRQVRAALHRPPACSDVTAGGAARRRRHHRSQVSESGRERHVSNKDPILELRGVSKSFGAVQALYEVDFHVAPGEVMALVGDNGAGKSTLIKSIAGIYPIDEGEVVFDGQPVSIHGPKDAAKLGIEVVYQDLALCDNLDVVQNMFLGREELSSLRRLDETLMEKRATDTLASLSVTTIRSVRQTVASLSGGQRQSVAVAKAVMWNSKVVILDEPTAALGVAQTRQVLDLVKRLGEQGLAVVLISHNLHDIFEVADTITVLRLGQNVAEYKRTEVTQTQVVEAITAGALSKVPGAVEAEVTA